jgi:Tfp pilus assembly PilM family ATPase
MKYRLLPLGVDIGSLRARIAVAETRNDGDVRIRAVASRDLPDGVSSFAAIESPELVAALLDEMIRELGVRQRRCVTSFGAPASTLRVLRFPKMSWGERVRAAKFEAARFVPWDFDSEPTAIRIHVIDRAEQLYAVGAVQRLSLDSRVAACRSARLHIVAVDDDAFALRRALPHCDAILDIGADRVALHAFHGSGPTTLTLGLGGAHVTRGIARDLSIDLAAAERRKRILGTAGAGSGSRDDLIVQIADAIARARQRGAMDRVALTGNGARLPGLAAGLERITGAVVEVPVSELLQGEAYPDDVLRAAAPDWSLAAGLATWGVAV